MLRLQIFISSILEPDVIEHIPVDDNPVYIMMKKIDLKKNSAYETIIVSKRQLYWLKLKQHYAHCSYIAWCLFLEYACIYTHTLNILASTEIYYTYLCFDDVCVGCSLSFMSLSVGTCTLWNLTLIALYRPIGGPQNETSLSCRGQLGNQRESANVLNNCYVMKNSA